MAHRIDGDGHVSNMFTEGVPNVTPATQVTDDWLNDVQEEICNFVEDQGVTLVKGTGTQMLTALLSTAKTWLAAHVFTLLTTFQKGVLVTQSTSNGKGVEATGNGSGEGVKGTGGATGHGVSGRGGASDGFGGTFSRGDGDTSIQSAVRVVGPVNLAGANPASNVPFVNQISPMNLIKAWATVTCVDGSNPTLVAGFNIESITQDNSGGGTDGQFTVNLGGTGSAAPMASAAYGVLATPELGVGANMEVTNKAGGSFKMRMFDYAGNPMDSAGTHGTKVTFLVLGAQ